VPRLPSGHGSDALLQHVRCAVQGGAADASESNEDERVLMLEAALADLSNWTIQLHTHPDFRHPVISRSETLGLLRGGQGVADPGRDETRADRVFSVG
jgi:hypothetical protein